MVPLRHRLVRRVAYVPIAQVIKKFALGNVPLHCSGLHGKRELCRSEGCNSNFMQGVQRAHMGQTVFGSAQFADQVISLQSHRLLRTGIHAP